MQSLVVVLFLVILLPAFLAIIMVGVFAILTAFQPDQRHFWHEIQDAWDFARRRPVIVFRSVWACLLLGAFAVVGGLTSVYVFWILSQQAPAGQLQGFLYRTALLLGLVLYIAYPVQIAVNAGKRWYRFFVLRRSSSGSDGVDVESLSWGDRAALLVCLVVAGTIAFGIWDVEGFLRNDLPRFLPRFARKLQAVLRNIPEWHRPGAAALMIVCFVTLVGDLFIASGRQIRSVLSVRSVQSD